MTLALALVCVGLGYAIGYLRGWMRGVEHTRTYIDAPRVQVRRPHIVSDLERP